MEEATLAVVGSITAALLGAVVGAAINGRSARKIEAARDTRDESRRQVEVKAAARLVYTDLEIARVGLQSTLDRGLVLGTYVIPTSAWPAHGVLLAAALPPRAYDAVAEACVKVAVWVSGTGGGAFPQPPGAPPGVNLAEAPEVRQAAEKLLGKCLRALDVLRPLAYDTDGIGDSPGVAP